LTSGENKPLERKPPQAEPRAQGRLETGFAWSFTGNAVNGLSQWGVLSLIAKLSNAEVLGQYALAIAVATPVAMLAHLNLRSVIATDVRERNPFADYLAVRRWAGFSGIAVTTLIGLFWSQWNPVGIAIVLAGASLGAENFQDLYHGVMQRNERMDLIAKSMILRSILSVSIAAAFLLWSQNAIAAVGGLLAGRLLTLLLFDRRTAQAPRDLRQAPGAVFRSALPLGLALMLVALTATLPRYVIELRLGDALLGIFVVISSFVTLGSVVMNALGQSAMTRLARAFTSGDHIQFRHLTLQLIGLAVGLGLIGALIAATAGDFFLGLIYRPEFREYKWLLMRMLLAATLGYVAAILGYIVTSMRQFDQQLPLLMAVAATSGLVCLWTMPQMGLDGAVVALASAATVQIAGNLFILRKARQ